MAKSHLLPSLPENTIIMTLEQLLQSRDRRAAMQRLLLEKYSGHTPVVLTVVMPGAEKQTKAAAIVAEAAVEALDKAFGNKISSRLLRDLTTGFEAYLTVDMPADQAKKTTVEIEENHPLGRLMDIDVIGPDAMPVSRRIQRRCLICNRPARECMRARSHSTQELLCCIDHLCDEYLQHP